LQSYDGTSIAYQIRGDGPPVVLTNGLGGTYAAFRHVYRALGDRHRTLCWDYRGLYESGPPPRQTDVSIEHQIRDLLSLLDHEGIDRAVFVGWSMGVQVNFEMCRNHADRVAGIVAINGAAGRPFQTAFAGRIARHVIPGALRMAKSQSRLLGAATQRTVAWPGLIPLMQRLGLVAGHIDMEVFHEVASGFAGLDVETYCETLLQLGHHDARDVLRGIRAPVLIITGDRDRMTPVSTAREMHGRIPGARLVVISGGTHYTPIEYPDVVHDEVRDFVASIPGYLQGSRAASAGE